MVNFIFKLKVIWISIFSKPKKNRSVFDAARELIKLETYWTWKRHNPLTCRPDYLSKHAKQFGIEYCSVSSAVIGYIEHLEAELKKVNGEASV